jgi:hypothetical protein
MKRLLMFASMPLAGVCFAPSDETGAGVLPDAVPDAPPAQVDPAVAAAQKAEAAAAAKALKETQKAEAKAKRDADAAEKKAAKEKAAADAKAAKDKEKADKEAAKVAAKADAEKAKEASKMPEQNGVRRPKPDTLCGKAWAIFDQVSAKNQATASIGESMEAARTQGLNEANVRAEYARWRKFYGVTGRVAAPKPAEVPPAPPAPEVSTTPETVPAE